MKKKIIYFDCYMGISGDMILAACLDLGADETVLAEELRKLHLPGIALKVKKEVKNGFSGTNATILYTEENLKKHTLSMIRERILESGLDDPIKERALSVFGVIAEAKAQVHGKAVDEVDFFELGAADSIAEICAAAICLHLLGVEQVYCSVLREGSGFVECKNGLLPVPVPAVVKMMPGSGIEIVQTEEIRTELVTPTGFGFLKGTHAICGPMPQMSVEAVGLGFGKREAGGLNGLRAILGSIQEEGDESIPAAKKMPYTHAHQEEHKKRTRNRLAKAIGHLERVKQMVEDDRDCSEVLIQLAAVRSALTSTGKYILKEHMSHCLIDAVEKKQFSEIEDLNRAIEQFIK